MTVGVGQEAGFKKVPVDCWGSLVQGVATTRAHRCPVGVGTE